MLKTLRSGPCFFLLTAALLSSACSTISVNKARMDSVKSAAVVGFGADLQGLKPPRNANRGGVMGTINAVNSIRKMSDGRSFEERTAQAQGSLELLNDRLAKDLGWKVLSYASTSSNATYGAEYQERTASKWGASTAEALGSKLFVKGIMWDSDAARMNHEERAALMKALDVDALAVATIEFRVGRTSGFGSVTRYPQAILKLRVYDLEDPDPIWSDRWAAGEPASEGMTTVMGFADTRDATPILLEAVENGLDTLIGRYREATSN